MGLGEWTEDKVATDYNLADPALRDTATLMFAATGEIAGWVALRFKASVPGEARPAGGRAGGGSLSWCWRARGGLGALRDEAGGVQEAGAAASTPLPARGPFLPHSPTHPPRAGIWPLHCHILPHAAMGQQVLVVVAPSKVRPTTALWGRGGWRGLSPQSKAGWVMPAPPARPCRPGAAAA
jgi:hypothetical protein